MAYSKVEYPDAILKQKMKEWGITRNEDKIPVYYTQLLTQNFLQNYFREIGTVQRIMPERKEIENLKRRVSELERRVGTKRAPSKVDEVYALFKGSLEQECFGKIVAIDTDSKEVVGVGDSVLEAYDNANKKTGKTQFDFRRVGFKYIHEV